MPPQGLYLRGQSVIGVTTTIPRGGASTLSAAVARSIALCEKSAPKAPADPAVALLVSERLMESYAASYPGRVVRGGKAVRLDGVDVMAGRCAAVAGRSYAYAVLDLGYIPPAGSAAHKGEYAEMARELEVRCNLRLAAMPASNPAELRAASDFLRGKARLAAGEVAGEGEVGEYSYLVWGATSQVFEAFRGQVRSVAPRAFVADEGYLNWPMQLDEPPAAVLQAVAGVIPKRLLPKGEPSGTRRLTGSALVARLLGRPVE